jgi:hypothetical protein
MDEGTSRRATQIEGLRALADLLEADAGMPVLHGVNVAIFADSEDAARAVLARADKVVKWEVRRHDRPEHRFFATLRIAGVTVDFWADPAWVCSQGATRVVREWSFQGAPVQVPA